MYYVVDKEVIEKDTGHVVNTYDTEELAHQACRDLNLGSGFQGWTPGFFCEVYSHKKKRR